MPILNLQQRARELGRIRIGQVTTTANGKTRPSKLDRFRLTSNSQALLEKVASLYGGTVQPWTPQGGGPAAFEVLTDATRLPIMVPPQPVSQWYELWAARGCVHRCDGVENALTGEPCDLESAEHRAAIEHPTTRLNVVLRDVEGIGVWRLETKGWNAAVELPNAAAFLAQAGGYVNGWVSLEERVSKAIVNDKPQTRRFMVPIIEIDVTPAELMAGRGRVAAPPMIGGPVEVTPPALAAAGPDYAELADEATNLDELRKVWNTASEAGHMTDELNAHMVKRAADLTPTTTPDEVVEAEVVEDEAPAPTVAEDEDADVIWERIIKTAGTLGLSLTETKEGFAAQSGGLIADDATAAELQPYLDSLRELAQAEKAGV